MDGKTGDAKRKTASHRGSRHLRIGIEIDAAVAATVATGGRTGAHFVTVTATNAVFSRLAQPVAAGYAARDIGSAAHAGAACVVLGARVAVVAGAGHGLVDACVGLAPVIRARFRVVAASGTTAERGEAVTSEGAHVVTGHIEAAFVADVCDEGARHLVGGEV